MVPRGRRQERLRLSKAAGNRVEALDYVSGSWRAEIWEMTREEWDGRRALASTG